VNPLRPTQTFLRRLARIAEQSADARARAWADEVDRRFSRVSIVKTYRGGRLCGYEVWRHLASSGEDPRRHKARLWFGLKHWRTELGYEGAARDMARRAARRLQAMNRRELAKWWQQRTQARRSSTTWQPDEHLLEVRLDYTDLQRMSHIFQKAT
jgi:hypothetical protein